MHEIERLLPPDNLRVTSTRETPRAAIKVIEERRTPYGARGGRLRTPTPVMCLWYRRDLRAIEDRVPARLGQYGSPLTMEPRVSASYLSIGRVFCVIPVHGKDVTAEDGTDRPAEPPVFNPPGLSDPVDQGLPSATSSLRVRAQSYSSYSRFQLHVNGGPSFSNLDTCREQVNLSGVGSS